MRKHCHRNFLVFQEGSNYILSRHLHISQNNLPWDPGSPFVKIQVCSSLQWIFFILSVLLQQEAPFCGSVLPGDGEGPGETAHPASAGRAEAHCRGCWGQESSSLQCYPGHHEHRLPGQCTSVLLVSLLHMQLTVCHMHPQPSTLIRYEGGEMSQRSPNSVIGGSWRLVNFCLFCAGFLWGPPPHTHTHTHTHTKALQQLAWNTVIYKLIERYM